MKYLNKDYWLKKSYIDCLNDYSPIDGEKDFEFLYEEKLNERIKKAKISFDTPQKMMKTREETIDSYTPKAYPKYDLVSRRIVGYLTLEEVLKSYDYQKTKLDLMFENRGSFDEKKVRDLFKKEYEERLENGFIEIPYKFRMKADPRLLAIYLIPKDVYEEIRKYTLECQAYCNEAKKMEEEYFQTVKDKFSDMETDLRKKNFTPLVDIINKEDDLQFLFHFDGLRSQFSTGFSEYLFSHVTNMEKEEDITISESHERKSRYQDFFLIREVELSYDEKKRISFLLEMKPFGQITTISFDFDSAEINKNI